MIGTDRDKAGTGKKLSRPRTLGPGQKTGTKGGLLKPPCPVCPGRPGGTCPRGEKGKTGTNRKCPCPGLQGTHENGPEGPLVVGGKTGGRRRRQGGKNGPRMRMNEVSATHPAETARNSRTAFLAALARCTQPPGNQLADTVRPARIMTPVIELFTRHPYLDRVNCLAVEGHADFYDLLARTAHHL